LGKGDGEYLVLTDFDVYGDQIYVSSQQNNKMLVFDLNGTHLRDIKFSGYIGMNFKVLQDGFVVKSTGGGNKSAIFYNEQGKVLKEIKNSGKEFLRFSNDFVFFDYKDQPFMYFALNDTTYNIKNQYLAPKYVIDFGEKAFPINVIKNKEALMELLRDNRYLKYLTFATFNRYHYLEIYDGDYTYSMVVNKENHRIHYGNTLNYKGLFIYSFVGCTNYGPIMTWTPSAIKDLEKRLNTKFDFIPNKIDTSINANPGIVILTEK
jgi:hypothetical protein